MRPILAASDLTDSPDDGLRTAAEIAARTGAPLHAIHGVGAVGLTLREAMPHLEPEAQSALSERLRERSTAACAAVGIPASGCHVSYHDTLDALPDRAQALNASLIVVPATVLRRGTAIDGLRRLTRAAGCPVLVARPGPPPPFRSVLVPLGEEDLQRSTLQKLCEWLTPLYDRGPSPRTQTEIHVLHVARSLRQWRGIGAPLDQAVREAEGTMWGTARLLEHVRWAHDPAERILESAAYEEADLIALGPGAHEDDGAATPTWETVVGRARCSVLLMTPGMPRPDEPALGRGWEPMVLEPAVRA